MKVNEETTHDSLKIIRMKKLSVNPVINLKNQCLNLWKQCYLRIVDRPHSVVVVNERKVKEKHERERWAHDRLHPEHTGVKDAHNDVDYQEDPIN
jgi:hypothetical protein